MACLMQACPPGTTTQTTAATAAAKCSAVLCCLVTAHSLTLAVARLLEASLAQLAPSAPVVFSVIHALQAWLPKPSNK